MTKIGRAPDIDTGRTGVRGVVPDQRLPDFGLHRRLLPGTPLPQNRLRGNGFTHKEARNLLRSVVVSSSEVISRAIRQFSAFAHMGEMSPRAW
jgi:hypothetical protein